MKAIYRLALTYRSKFPKQSQNAAKMTKESRKAAITHALDLWYGIEERSDSDPWHEYVIKRPNTSKSTSRWNDQDEHDVTLAESMRTNIPQHRSSIDLLYLTKYAENESPKFKRNATTPIWKCSCEASISKKWSFPISKQTLIKNWKFDVQWSSSIKRTVKNFFRLLLMNCRAEHQEKIPLHQEELGVVESIPNALDESPKGKTDPIDWNCHAHTLRFFLVVFH